MSYPEQTSPILQAVSHNKIAEEGQIPSPVVADSIVIARDLDGEDGIAYVERLVGRGGPTEGGEGQPRSSASPFPRD